MWTNKQFSSGWSAMAAAAYNKKAKADGREDWRTAYRTDVLKLGDKNTTANKASNVWNNVSTPNTTPASNTIPASNVWNNVSTSTLNQKINNIKDSQQKVDLKTIQAKKQALDNNKQNEQILNENYQNVQKETEDFAQKQIDNAEAFYNEQNASLKKESDEIRELQEEQIDVYKERSERDAALLNEKKASEVAYLEAQAEYQRVQNQSAILQARIEVELQRQQSAWAYNKIGLWFSSGIINQSQQIATNGIIKIAELKARMNFQEATIKTKISETEFKYSELVNRTVDKYVDKIDNLKVEMEKRINDVNSNIRTNSYEKQKAINEIEEWARNKKREEEKQHINDIQTVRDKWIIYWESIQEDVVAYNMREITKLNTMVQNGTIVNMSPNDIAQKETELGLPVWTINTQLNNSIVKQIRGKFDQVLWATYPISNLTTLVDEVKQEMRSGRTYSQAIEIVMARELETNKDYKAQQETMSLAERRLQLDEKKLALDANYKAWTLDLGKYKAKTNRLKLMEDIKQRKSSKGWITSTWIIVNTSENIAKYTNDAWVKYNNTAWMKVPSAKSQQLLRDNGISFIRTGATWPWEKWEYMQFKSIEDSIKAQKILLSQTGWSDINERLQKWVWTDEWPSYAKQIMDSAWIPNWTKFEDLSEEQFNRLVYAQMQKESPWVYEILSKGGWIDMGKKLIEEATRYWISIKKSDTPQSIKAKINTAKIKSLKEWTIEKDVLMQMFNSGKNREVKNILTEINKWDDADISVLRENIASIVSELKSIGASNATIIKYINDMWINLTEWKSGFFNDKQIKREDWETIWELYIKGDQIYHTDTLGVNEKVYKLTK